MIKEPEFLHVDTNLWKLKLIEKYCGESSQKKWCTHSCFDRSLKSAVLHDGSNAINCFLHDNTNSWKLKVALILWLCNKYFSDNAKFVTEKHKNKQTHLHSWITSI